MEYIIALYGKKTVQEVVQRRLNNVDKHTNSAEVCLRAHQNVFLSFLVHMKISTSKVAVLVSERKISRLFEMLL